MSFLAAANLIPDWIVDLSPRLLGHLVDPALRTLAVAALAGLTLLVARDKSWLLRFSVWKVVVCTALAMPILASAMPPLAVALPFFDRLPELRWSAPKSQAAAVQDAYVPLPAAKARPIAADAHLLAARNGDVPKPTNGAVISPRSARSIKIPGFVVAAAVYVAVASYLAFRFLLGWFLSRRLRQGARTITERNIATRFAAKARAAGLRSVPRLAESERLTVPLTCGVLHPMVLFPADWRSWDADTLDAVMVHEISHVARRDALTERLALLHRTIFWFSPLSWWLRHRLAELAEEASDQAALAAGAEPTKYAEILLGFFEDLNSVTQRAEWQGVAMAQAGRAEKRLERILKGRMVVTTKIKKSLAAVVVLASIPVIMVSASMQPRRMGKQIVLSAYPAHAAVAKKPAQEQKPAVAPMAPAPVVAATPVPEEVPAVAPTTVASVEVAALPAPRAFPVPAVRAVNLQSAAPAAVPAVPQAPAAAPVPPVPAPRAFALRRGSYSFSTDGGDSYAIISAGSSTMSGSFAHADFAQLEALRDKLKTDFIWFERDGKSYIVTDPATVKRAMEAFAAQAELGRQQGELGEKQGALGEAQGALGEQQGALGEQMGELRWNLQNLKVDFPDLTAQMQELREKSQELRQVLSEKDLEEIRSSVAHMEKQIGEAQREMAKAQADTAVAHSIDSATMEKAMDDAREALEQQMEKFSADQEKLGTQQEILGKQQEELGRQQEKAAAKAQAEIRAIIDESLSRGTAQPAPKP